MKKYQEISIYDNPNQLKIIISRLKEWQKIFKYQPGKSREYAVNIFVDSDRAICMKTDRKSLFEASVWLVAYIDSIRLANITSPYSNLSVSDYNAVLIQFLRDVIEKIVFPKTKIILTGENIGLEDLMGKESLDYFNKWFNTCNKDTLISHTQDEDNFILFIQSLYRNEGMEFDFNMLGNIILDQYPFMTEEKIKTIEDYMEFGFRLFESFHKGD